MKYVMSDTMQLSYPSFKVSWPQQTGNGEGFRHNKGGVNKNSLQSRLK